MVDVVVAESLPNELLEEIGLLVRALGRPETGDIGVSLVPKPGHAVGRHFQRLVPICLAKMRQDVPGIDIEPLCRRVVATNQGLRQPMRMVNVVKAEAALDAKAVLVGGTVGAFDMKNSVILHLERNLAADAAYGHTLATSRS